MKLSDLPWPGRVIARPRNPEEDELAIALEGTPYILTICTYYDREEPEYSVVTRINKSAARIHTMDDAYELPPANSTTYKSGDERHSDVSRFELSSLLELLAAVDFFAQKYGANPTE